MDRGDSLSMMSPFPKGSAQFLLWVAISLMGVLLLGWFVYHARGRKNLPTNEKHYSNSELSFPVKEGTHLRCFFNAMAAGEAISFGTAAESTSAVPIRPLASRNTTRTVFVPSGTMV